LEVAFFLAAPLPHISVADLAATIEDFAAVERRASFWL
jgi:hypothetical protein